MIRLPEDYNQAARDALAHRPVTARESPARLRRDSRPIRRDGPGGLRWVMGQRLASWGSQLGAKVIATPCPERLPALTIPESKARQAR